MSSTLLLDTVTWDLFTDAAGNIAMAARPYAIAQDCASACRLFKGELWYDLAPGVPYFESVLGHYPSPAFMQAMYIKASLTVPHVISVKVFLDDIVDRRLSGQLQITDDEGAETVVGF